MKLERNFSKAPPSPVKVASTKLRKCVTFHEKVTQIQCNFDGSSSDDEPEEVSMKNPQSVRERASSMDSSNVSVLSVEEEDDSTDFYGALVAIGVVAVAVGAVMAIRRYAK